MSGKKLDRFRKVCASVHFIPPRLYASYATCNHYTIPTNRSGGIQGGISNGQDIYFRVAFKPVATLLMEQDTVNQFGALLTGSGNVLGVIVGVALLAVIVYMLVKPYKEATKLTTKIK